MKKVNFNQIKSVKTPENWIENAINNPKKNKKKPAYLNPYIIASAACFIFCCALCAVVFLNFGIDNPNPVAPAKSSGTSAFDVTDSTTPSSNLSVIPTIPNPITNNISSATTQQQTGSGQKSTNPSDTKKGNEQISMGKNPSNPHSVVTNPEPNETSGGSNSNTSSTKRPAIPDTPITNPTQGVTDPTEPPTAAPTPTQPEEPPFEEPSIEFVSSVYHYLPKYESAEYEEYYCHIESESGKSYSERFSEKERATLIITSEGKRKLQYIPINKGIYLEKGMYYVTFYNKSGTSAKQLVYLGNESVNIN